MDFFWDHVEGIIEFFIPRLWKGEYLLSSVGVPAEYWLGGTLACVTFIQILYRNWIEAVPIR